MVRRIALLLVASTRIVPGGRHCQGHPQVIVEVRRVLREHLVEASGADREGSLPGVAAVSGHPERGGAWLTSS
jgi:hypothetical protein